MPFSIKNKHDFMLPSAHVCTEPCSSDNNNLLSQTTLINVGIVCDSCPQAYFADGNKVKSHTYLYICF